MRREINLDGTWDFTADLDPKYHGLTAGYQDPGTNRHQWLKVPVPGVWQKYDPRYDIYEGVCWLAREFEVGELPADSRARLRFGGVNYLAHVFLNGELVGSHEGGYTEFVLDVTGKLKPGTNHLAVQADNRALITRWPHVLGYFNYGGIHRGVRLEVVSGPELAEIKLETAGLEGAWELSVRGRVDDAGEGLSIRVGCHGLSAATMPGPNDAFEVRLPLPDVPSWSPETPHLEPVDIELLDEEQRLLDAREFDFGFCSLSVQDGSIFLNGRAYHLKGVCCVYDSPDSGLVMASEQVETDLLLMKEVGCNAVRCHYPMDECFYAACDRLGLLVWIEPPVYCYHPTADEKGTHFSDPEWLALARQMAVEMIATARNHPCVAVYGIGNECNTLHPEAGDFFRSLAVAIRKADQTRLLSYAALYGNIGPLADVVDVLGINSYYGWYDRIDHRDGSDRKQGETPTGETPAIDLAPMRRMLDGVLEGKSDLVLLLTEFGADSLPGVRSATRELWSEDYHADLLQAVFALARDYPGIAGTFPFCFSDYRDPSKIHNGRWNGLNLKGVVDYCRRKKAAFEALREEYLAVEAGQ